MCPNTIAQKIGNTAERVQNHQPIRDGIIRHMELVGFKDINYSAHDLIGSEAVRALRTRVAVRMSNRHSEHCMLRMLTALYIEAQRWKQSAVLTWSEQNRFNANLDPKLILPSHKVWARRPPRVDKSSIQFVLDSNLFATPFPVPLSDPANQRPQDDGSPRQVVSSDRTEYRPRGNSNARADGELQQDIEPHQIPSSDPARGRPQGDNGLKQGPETFFCLECILTFGNKGGFVRHLRGAHGLQRYCLPCNAEFRDYEESLRHKWSCHPPKGQCLYCPLKCTSLDLLYEHVLESHKPVLDCGGCGGYFANKRTLADHRGKCKGPPTTQWVSCADCGTRYRNHTGLRRHQRRYHRARIRINQGIE